MPNLDRGLAICVATSAGGRGEEHDIVDRKIGDLPLAGYLALIGQYECLLDMVVLVLDKGVERAVYGIVLARLDLKGDSGKAAVIVDQVIDLALAAVVIVVQLIAMGGQFAGDDSLIDGSQIDALFIIQDGADIVPVKKARQEPTSLR